MNTLLLLTTQITPVANQGSNRYVVTMSNKCGYIEYWYLPLADICKLQLMRISVQTHMC